MSEQEASSPDFTKLIKDAKERVYAARAQYYDDQLRYGKVRLDTRRNLAQAALQYRSVLLEHSDESSVKEEWANTGADEIERLLHKTKTVDVPAPGHTSNTKSDERPAIMTIDAAEILKVTYRLDEIAKRLGWAPKTTDNTPHDDPDHEDLQGLVRLRGQDAVAENIPGGGG